MTDKDKELQAESTDQNEQSTDQNEPIDQANEPTERIEPSRFEQDELFHDEDIQDQPIAEQSATQAAPVNRSNRVWMITSIVLLAALIYALIQPPFGGSNDSESVATVNGVSISKEMYYDEMVKSGGTPVLDTMITNELITQEANNKGITVSESDLDNEIALYKKSYPSVEVWHSTLEQGGTSEEKLRLQLVRELQIRKLLADQTPVSEDEIKEFFTANLEALTTGDKAPTLEEKTDEIRLQLVYEKLSQVFPAWLDGLMADADIKNTLENK